MLRFLLPIEVPRWGLSSLIFPFDPSGGLSCDLFEKIDDVRIEGNSSGVGNFHAQVMLGALVRHLSGES